MSIATNIAHGLLEIVTAVKIYHWQTKSYARHKASDALFLGLNPLVDQFMEVAQGVYNTRVNFSTKKTIQLENVSDDDIIDILTEFSAWLSDFDTSVKNSELLNIRDEIKALVDQTLYLFTFE